MVILEIALDGSRRMMRTVSDVVDPRALRQKFRAHPVVQHIELGLGEEAARDAGLVGEEEHEIAGLVQAADRACRVRHPANAFACAHIAVVMVDDAVAIEEGGGLLDGAGRTCAAHFREASRIKVCSISSQMP